MIDRVGQVATVWIVLAGLGIGTVWGQAGGEPVAKPAAEQATDGVYSDDPEHVWNRLHRALFRRAGPDGTEYGHDEVDLLLWPETDHLLAGESHPAAIAALDAFLHSGGAEAIASPVAKALLQHDLWGVFDWTLHGETNEHAAARRALRLRLAKIIRQLALTSEQIGALPDNYQLAVAAKMYRELPTDSRAESFLPPRLFSSPGDWRLLIDAGSARPVAESHVESATGRSTFLVLLRLPGGLGDTDGYLERLAAAADRWATLDVFGPRAEPSSSPLPPLPVGTLFALVRRMNLISSDQEVITSPLTESIQLRMIRSTIEQAATVDELQQSQSFHEFTFRRRDLLSTHPRGLWEVRPDQRAFIMLSSHSADPFEGDQPMPDGQRPTVLDACIVCHRVPGSTSFLSYTRPLLPRALRAPSLAVDTARAEAGATISWKQRQRDWGQLQGIFDALSQADP